MPLYSMTAYGQGEEPGNDGISYICEIRTLNSRYLETTVRLPRHLMALETEIINAVKGELRRGKIDVFFEVTSPSTTRELPQLDPAAVQHYARLFEELQQTLEKSLVSSFAALQDPLATDFLRLEGVLQTPERQRSRGVEAADQHREGIFNALKKALDAVKKARATEGQALQQALSDLLANLDGELVKVVAKRPEIVTQLQKQFVKRVEAAINNLQKSGQSLNERLSEDRLMMEIAVLTDKSDIEEEVTRLGTHIQEFQRLMKEDDGAGRKLDFLCQEMHREVNTMSNKLVQTEIAQHTIEMKQIIERIRQQVQNIE